MHSVAHPVQYSWPPRSWGNPQTPTLPPGSNLISTLLEADGAAASPPRKEKKRV